MHYPWLNQRRERRAVPIHAARINARTSAALVRSPLGEPDASSGCSPVAGRTPFVMRSSAEALLSPIVAVFVTSEGVGASGRIFALIIRVMTCPGATVPTLKVAVLPLVVTVPCVVEVDRSCTTAATL